MDIVLCEDVICKLLNDRLFFVDNDDLLMIHESDGSKNWTDNLTTVMMLYPSVKKSEYVNRCGRCGNYFIGQSDYCIDCQKQIEIAEQRIAEYKQGRCVNCGKLLTGKQRKYCSDECKAEYRRKTVNPKLFYDKASRNLQKIKDYNSRGRNWDFNEDDRFWGLGSSNLLEHMSNNVHDEEFYVGKELDWIKSQKPNGDLVKKETEDVDTLDDYDNYEYELE